MSLQLEYRGFRGSASYNPVSRQHYGLLLGIPDRIVYEAYALESLVANFEAATDEYISLLAAADLRPDLESHDIREITLTVRSIPNA